MGLPKVPSSCKNKIGCHQPAFSHLWETAQIAGNPASAPNLSQQEATSTSIQVHAYTSVFTHTSLKITLYSSCRFKLPNVLWFHFILFLKTTPLHFVFVHVFKSCLGFFFPNKYPAWHAYFSFDYCHTKFNRLNTANYNIQSSRLRGTDMLPHLHF